MTPNPSSGDRDRLDVLLTDRALFGLAAAEVAELTGLQKELGTPEDTSLDAVAAALALGLAEQRSIAPLPRELRRKVEAEATAFFAADESANVIHLDDRRRAAESGAATVIPPRPAKHWWLQGGWFAAAACLALVFWSWWGPNGDDRRPTPRALRSELIASADARAERISWTTTDDPAARSVSGDVVWSDVRQEGYLRFSGLPANDPTTAQYQLWIFDADRDERFPVDGGVFDVPAGAREVIVPILAKLPVRDATLFAITIEKPGGVVVSSRERLVVLADPSAAEG